MRETTHDRIACNEFSSKMKMCSDVIQAGTPCGLPLVSNLMQVQPRSQGSLLSVPKEGERDGQEREPGNEVAVSDLDRHNLVPRGRDPFGQRQGSGPVPVARSAGQSNADSGNEIGPTVTLTIFAFWVVAQLLDSFNGQRTVNKYACIFSYLKNDQEIKTKSETHKGLRQNTIYLIYNAQGVSETFAKVNP